MNKKILPILLLLFSACTSQNTLFTQLSASETGIEFENSLTEVPDFNVVRYGYFYNGGGVAAADFNNDGLTDLYFTGNLKANKLYLNKGDMAFEDITKQAGVAAQDGWNTGVCVVDINSDGFQDIYVCRSAAESPALRKNLLFINNKNLTFTEKSAEYGLDDSAYSSHATFFDYDQDGDLDAFLLNHSIQKYAGFNRSMADYKKEYDPQFSSRLMRNDNGKFTDVSQISGITTNVLSFGLGVAVSDLNNDGWLDLYVSNDYNEEDYLYINQKNGSFKESIRDAIGHTSLFSMGNDAADINNDGLVDVFTSDMMPVSNRRIKMTSGDDNYQKYNYLIESGFHHQISRNMLQLNNGNGSFSEIGQLAGISNSDWSWSPIFADLDLDGNKDLYVTTGYARDYTNMDFLKFTADEQTKVNASGQQTDIMEVIKKMPTINEPNKVYRNHGDLTFEDKNIDWGLDQKIMSNGSVIVDLDNDGDLDIVTNNINEKASIFKNNSTKKNILKVDLKADNQSRIIGSKIIVHQKDKLQLQEYTGTRGYQSSCIAPLVFGLKDTTFVDSLVVIWSDGKSETLKNFKAEKQVTFNYKDANFQKFKETPKGEIIFESVDNQLFNHQQARVQDFKIQPLLPRVQSIVGPQMLKSDLNNDGKNDLLILGGMGQESKTFLNRNGNFVEIKQLLFQGDSLSVKTDATFGDFDKDGDQDLVIARGGYAINTHVGTKKPTIYFNNGKGVFTTKKSLDFEINSATISAGDIDSDGDIDLFIGSSCEPQNYPKSEKSVLCLNNGKGEFSASKNLFSKDLKLITDSKLIDLNNDSKPDLIVTQDFGPVLCFYNNGSKESFDKSTQITESGLWNTLETGDLDNDGDQDLVLGNIGKNYQPVLNTKSGLRLDAVDFSKNGKCIPLLSVNENDNWFPFIARDEMLDQKPALRKRFLDYAAYSVATIDDIIDDEPTLSLEANKFETIILINEKGKFKQIPFPIQAQFSQIHVIQVYDFNGDGRNDIFLAGNENQARVRIGKSDANYGQLFLNTGKNNFQFSTKSGLKLKGDIRGVSIIDKKLIIGVNGEKVQIFKF